MIVSQPSVLIVDAEPLLFEQISRMLRGAGFQVTAVTGQRAVRLCEEQAADVLVYHLLPRSYMLDDLCHQVRALSTVPIIALSSWDLPVTDPHRSDLAPIDYLMLPLEPAKLVERIEAALRLRRAQPPRITHLRVGRLEIDLAGKRVLRAGQLVRLSRIEWALLEELLRSRGATLTHRMLLRQVWGDAYGEETVYVRVYINRLRRKLEDDPAAPRYFVREPGIGYRFERPEQEHAPAATAPIRTAPATNLPLPRTALLGRAHEHATACNLLRRANVRLLTMSGTGGVGKTRLAIEVAGELRGSFAQGVFFVALAALRDPELVLPAIAQTLGVRQTGSHSLADALARHLRAKQLLLVLDNFEQVLGAAASLAPLLAAAPQLKLLVTSRALLHLADEYEFPLLPLALPNLQQLPPLHILAHSPAVALFAERARGVAPEFALTQASAKTVAEICAYLEGLPLAIELAAARTRLLTPKKLLARLSGRLTLLTGGPHDGEERHRSLRAVIAWSYELLASGEQALFARLGIFDGGCTPAAVEQVCRHHSDATPLDVLAGLDTLVGNNLLIREQLAEGEIRFVMLETLRDYALEQLARRGEQAATQQHHAAYYLELATEAGPELKGPKQQHWLARLGEEHDNLRAALRWLLDTAELEQALHLSGALWLFWYMHGHFTEGRHWIEELLKRRVFDPSHALVKALNGAGTLAGAQGDYTQGRVHLEESLRVAQQLGDRRGIAFAFNNLGLTIALHDYERAAQLFEESVQLCRELGDQHGLAISLGNLGVAMGHLGQFPRAKALSEESLALHREADEKWGSALCLTNLGYIAMLQYDDFDRAIALGEEGVALMRELGDPGISEALHNLVRARLARGNLEQARALCVESLELASELGRQLTVVDGLEAFANVEGRCKRPEQAAQLFGAAQRLRDANGYPRRPVEGAHYQHALRQARGQCDEATWQAAWSAGQAMTLEQALAYALEREDALLHQG